MPRRNRRGPKSGEVHTWSDRISDGVVDDLVAALLARPAKVSREFDIPYVAGYSDDGRTIFIDRHMPRSFRYRGRLVETDRFLVVHEVTEKAMLDQLRLHYLHAHQIALRVEQAAVRAAGVGWREYDTFARSQEKSIGSEELKHVPSNLDLTPYRDEKDFRLLRAMAAAEGKR